ncbi:aquaporin-like protein [Phyllosticta capitalensis]
MNIDPPADNPIVLPGMKRKTSERPPPRPLHGFSWLPTTIRNHFIAMIGEFAGTFLFLFFAFSATQVANAGAAAANEVADTIVANAPNTSVLLYISLAFGFSLAVNVWVFFRISGGLFNPAVTVGLCLIGAVGWIRGFLVILAQIVGGIASAAAVSALFPGDLAVRTTLGGGTSIVRGLFIEMFLTLQLIFTIFMLAAEKHKGTFLAPVGIGLSLFIAELGGVYFTGGSLNPARSFGPDVILHTFNGYHWIYWVGPFLGALLAVLLYRIIKILEYETANPGADFDEKDAEVFYPDEDPAVRNAGSAGARYDGPYAPAESNLGGRSHSDPNELSSKQSPALRRQSSLEKLKGVPIGGSAETTANSTGTVARHHMQREQSSSSAFPSGMNQESFGGDVTTRAWTRAPQAERGVAGQRKL